MTRIQVPGARGLLLIALILVSVFLIYASDSGSGDWPMWGGTPDRNMVSNQKVVASWDVKTGKNVKWVSQLGSQILEHLARHAESKTDHEGHRVRTKDFV